MSDIDVFGSGALKDFQFRLFEDQEGHPHVAVRVDTKTLVKIGLTGEIWVSDRKSGIRDSVLATLLVQPIVSIAPDPVWLSWSPTKSCFVGSSLLKLNLADDMNAPGELSVSAKTEGARQ